MEIQPYKSAISSLTHFQTDAGQVSELEHKEEVIEKSLHLF